MSNTAFVESQSSDPFVRELSRSAVRILNDQTLDRRQREALIRRLQARLLGHQAKQAQKAAQKVAKAAKKGGSAERRETGLVQADQRQVLSLRKEFSSEAVAEVVVPTELREVIPAAIAANDGYYPNRRRSVLTLKRA
jgi:hypothetical protein